MRPRTAPRAAFLIGVVVSLVAIQGLAEDIMARVQRLSREGHYDLALALLEDHESRGSALTPQMKWARARLVPDADRFDRLAAELVSGKSAADSLVQSVVLSRGREQFARGQYLSALESFKNLPPSATARYPALPVFQAMSARAVGETRGARQTLESIADSSPQYAMAQMLLADLTLRSGELESALEHADRALEVDAETVGAQAHYVRAQALGRRGEEGAAASVRAELVRGFPRSVEAAWVREQAGGGYLSESDRGGVPEVEAPVTRHEFALQFGAFHDRRLALRLAGQLTGAVDDLRLERDLTASPAWYRVVGGRYTTRSVADAALATLQDRDIQAVVLRPGRGG